LVSFFRVAPVSEDIRRIYHVHRARDLRETRICIIDTALENNNNQLPTSTPHTYHTVIFVPVDKASIPTLISRRTDQEIRNKLELENRTGNSTRIAWPCLFHRRRKLHHPQSSRPRISLTADASDRLENCIFTQRRLRPPSRLREFVLALQPIQQIAERIAVLLRTLYRPDGCRGRTHPGEDYDLPYA